MSEPLEDFPLGSRVEFYAERVLGRVASNTEQTTVEHRDKTKTKTYCGQPQWPNVSPMNYTLEWAFYCR